MYYKSLERRKEYTRSIQATPKKLGQNRKTFFLSRQKPLYKIKQGQRMIF